MIFRGLVAATVAAAMSATPALAAANTAPSTIAPASETVSGAQQFGDDGGELIVYLLALVATGLLIWVLVDKKDRVRTSVG